ncbi:E3 ubiquitin-protein ligase RNF213-like isoform X3 [Lineus longissimus]|uniref:E3 ubiquitin-protein ligase RNF213-like isoform X3 n=1 Tax=Lineus longissimus TaxID=88925 RepID=UPI00315C51FE
MLWKTGQPCNRKNQEKQPHPKSHGTANSRNCQVHFHVVLHKDFVYNRSKDSVCIRFNHSHLVGSSDRSDQHRMKEIEENEGYVLFELVVEIPETVQGQVQYKYVFVHQSEEKKPHHVLEWLHGFGKDQQHSANRDFQMNRQNGDRLDLFDGLMNLPPEDSKGFLHTLKNIGKSVSGASRRAHRDDVKEATLAMLPRWHFFCCKSGTGEDLTASPAYEVIRRIDGVYTYMERSLKSGHRQTISTTWKEILWQYLKPWKEHMKAQLKEKKILTKENAEIRLVSALCIIQLICKIEGHLSADLDDLDVVLECLLLRPDNNRCIQLFMETVSKHFNDLNKSLLSPLLSASMLLVQHAQAPYSEIIQKWLYMTPVIHALTEPPDHQQEYQDMHKTAGWWGVRLFNQVQDKFKKSMDAEGRLQLDFLVKKLSPLFDFDPLLPRTLMTTVSWRHLLQATSMPDFPPDCCIAVCYHYIRTKDYIYLQDREVIEQCCRAVVEKIKALQATPDVVRTRDAEYLLSLSMSLVDLLISETHFQGSRWHKERTLVTDAVGVLAASMSYCNYLSTFMDEHNHAAMLSWLQQELRRAQKRILSWLHQILPERMKERTHFSLADGLELEIFSKLLYVEYGFGGLDQFWIQGLIDKLSYRIQQVSPRERAEMFCCGLIDFSKYHKLIETRFSDAVFDILNEVDLLRIGYDSSSAKFRILVSSKFRDAWRKEVGDLDNRDRILLHLLSWPASPGYLEIYQNGRANAILEDECKQNMALAASVITDLHERLWSHDISVEEFELIMKNKESFIALSTVLIIGRKQTLDEKTVRDEVIAFLDMRQYELEYYRETCQKLPLLIDACCSFPCVNVGPLGQIVQRDVQNAKIRELVTPIPHQHYNKKGRPLPEIIAFAIHPAIIGILDDVRFVKLSLILKNIWNRLGHLQTRRVESGAIETLDLKAVVEDIWAPAWKEWHQVILNLKVGNATLQDIDKYFSVFEARIPSIAEELRAMKNFGDNDLDVGVVLGKIEVYYQLEHYADGARAILQVKDIFGLAGDFKTLEMLANVERSKNQSLNLMDRTILKTGQLYKDISPEQIRCLQVIGECNELIKWLKKEIGGTKDLKVFVDLASISAGEGDYNMDRVHVLHSVITGYAPLICDLPEDADAETFLSHCEMVWGALKSDPKLPKKLKSTQGLMDWLKFVKDSHGSVEVSSLSEADAINARGIYKVGNLKKGHKKMEDMIELIVPTEKEGEVSKRYSFEQLTDLQSKLMLVSTAKRGAEDDSSKHAVDRFTEIFEGVTTLAKTYVKICFAGNVLFHDWVSTIVCDPKRNVNLKVNIQLEEGILTDSREGDVIGKIHHLEKFMADCLNEWRAHLSEQRSTFPQLNHFTTAQIVTLRGDFAKVRNKEQLDVTTYDMLHNIKCHCTHEDLIAAVDDAENFLRVHTAPIQKETPVNESGEDAEVVPDVREVLEKLTDGGVSEKLARLAVKECGLNVDDCTLWCFENEDKDDDDDDQSESSESDDAADDLNAMQPTMSDVTSKLLNQLYKSKLGLCDQLRDLWHGFLENVSTSVKDYLSVKHLGMILDALADRENTVIKRSFPPVLKSGRPNLIVCPEDDVYITALSLYMDDKPEDVPLPNDDEVLLCTVHTTAEEVELLWQRAVNDQQRKIFCLVNADLLDYDVSDQVEKSLDSSIKGKEDFRLAIICSAEREDTSRIVTALDRDRRSLIPCKTEQVMDYLHRQFQKDLDSCGGNSAAKVEFEKLSVRLVKSSRAGVGKSLLIKKRSELLGCQAITVRLHERHMTDANLVANLVEKRGNVKKEIKPTLFHIDIGHDVVEGVNHVLFNLLVLRCVKDATGRCWRRHPSDLYMIENLPLLKQEVQRTTASDKVQYVHQMLNILPSVTCHPPKETLAMLRNETNPEGFLVNVPLIYEDICKHQEFRRPFNHLKTLTSAETQSSRLYLWLELLLSYCGVENGDPSWSELHNFASFLNTQLADAERSAFCSDSAQEFLPGFTVFVVKFMVQMSKDFATRSLMVSEETPQLLRPQVGEDEDKDGEVENDDGLLALRRRWESSPHPYIFFNPDGQTFTFLGFNIDRRTGNLIDNQTRQILNTNIMSRQLFDALVGNGVKLTENFDTLRRIDKIKRLRNVMGLDDMNDANWNDPDQTYELTTDNVKKMLAIYMRFRCGIPVVVMGETGCGKTRLIKFMCDLQVPLNEDIKNLVLMKIHGGTTHLDIIKKVQEAEKLAVKNRENNPKMYTILFFDEANTTEAIGLIKEIMCDNSINGEQISTNAGLKFVAACNPYRKHTKEMIQNLEQAGLGYNVKADKTADKLGRVPMRHLVYRVQPLPQSMLPLVWDFGQLSDEVERMYIKQMVQRYMTNGQIPNGPELNRVITNILAASQRFMRTQQNECSFVSLRDVERTMNVMAWFYERIELLKELMDDLDDEDEETVGDVTRSLILALGVCYHACLQEQTRGAYRDIIAEHFEEPCALPDPRCILDEINRCQDLFLDQAQITEPNIAHNQALKENLFMMVVCIELRIPLFLVGKPGSSKSLAKLIVTDAMQGETAKTPLFKSLKQVHMVSFQCSPLATPDGIKGTFKQCAMFQKKKNLEQFVSVVVLDEVGLAEDSPRMPLKTLHPLLEDGTCGDDEQPDDDRTDDDGNDDDDNVVSTDYKKVAFIGISNWALDPAKMNRGILVQRDVPDENELIRSAEGICSTKKQVLEDIRPLIPRMANAYLELYRMSFHEIREFFGLRDFYSLVKMVYAFAEKSGAALTWHQLEHAVRRNFGGIENVNPVKVFKNKFPNMSTQRKPDDPKCDTEGLIKACLSGDGVSIESRYLLILTENYAALGILKKDLLNMEDFIAIFGSSFRSDQEYTQVCRNINRIKKCMETGKTVVLLNLESLYESLYDALNQYYVYMGGERYVDLGLGTHRVKCRVDARFRLIVVAEKEVVYKEFPIPLINRLEKHVLAMTTMLSEKQIKVTKRIEKWAKDYVTPKFNTPVPQSRRKEIVPGDVFCGYHDDTAASVVLQISKELDADETSTGWAEKFYNRCKDVLLMCATPESVVRLKDTRLAAEWKALSEKYFIEQTHDSLSQVVSQLLKDRTVGEGIFLEVTTKSHLFAKNDARILSRRLGIGKNFTLLALQAMDTKQQFSRELRKFFDQQDNDERLMLLQCDSGDRNSNLIACARYQIMEEFTKSKNTMRGKAHFVFIVQMPRVMAGSFIGFQGGRWSSVYIDDLRVSHQPAIMKLSEQSIGDLIGESVRKGSVGKGIGQCLQQKHALSFIDDVHDDVLENHETWQIQPSPERLNEIVQMTTQRAQEHGGCRPIDRSVEQFLDVDALIQSCIQSAASIVKDPEFVPSERATERLHIILEKVSQKEDVNSLMSAMKVRVLQLFQEKEGRTSVHSMASDWLSKEAAATETINRVGTFRKAVQMVMENKLTPILAGLVAYMDTNCNLDILKKNETRLDDVIRQLWLQMFADNLVTPLSYTQFQSPTIHVDVTEMIAPQTGNGHHLFKPQFPFSWEIHSQMELIIQTAQRAPGEEMELTCQRLFQESPVGKSLTRFMQDQPETVQDELMEQYLKDFVHLCFKAVEEDLEQILIKTLKIAFREVCQTLKLDGEDGTRLTIQKLHLTHAKCRERLDHFIYACSIWPECLELLKESKHKELSNTLTEMTLDVIVLIRIIDHINNVHDEHEKQEHPLKKKIQGRRLWIDRVKLFKPLAERIMQQTAAHGQGLPLGALCQKYVEEYRPLWTRICVVQLFMDHVCPPHVKTEADRVDSVGPVWMYLSKDVDFKKASTVEKVAKYLKTCKNRYVKKLYKNHLKCPGCQEEKSDPVQLPCKHSICRKCLNDQIEADDRICLKCKAEIPEAFQIPDRVSNRDADIAYNKYINASNQFFMDIISQLCFAEDSPPQQDVVNILMSYVIHEPQGQESRLRSRTKQFTVYDECIDPTPVLRSLLLQLLLRYDIDDVREHLQLYFEKSQGFLENKNHVIELSLLCTRCYEDSYHSHCSSDSRGDVLEMRIRMATEHLGSACNNLEREELDINKVEAIAKTRFGLGVAAEMMYRVHVAEEDGHDRDAVEKLWQAAWAVHDNSKSDWPRLYLVKQLCRTYGMDCLHQVSQVQYLGWILPEEARNNQNDGIDRLVLFGDHYTRLRDSVVNVTLGKPLQDFASTCEGLKGNNRVKEVACLLALHQAVFAQNMFEENVKHRISDEIIDNLLSVCINQTFMKNKQAAHDILERSKSKQLGPEPVRADETTKAIKNLLRLFNLVIQSSNKTPALLKPLRTMMSAPRKMVASYLPTMPQDHLEELRTALLAAKTAYENPVFYACSNGHPYIIGDCGGPYYTGKCQKCGVTIGGRENVSADGNVRLDTRDNTQTGHILGRADMRDLTPVPERDLTPAVTIILRLLLHLSMHIGTNHDAQAVADMIRPNIGPDEVCTFLLDHIRHDIQQLARALGKSPDDCLSVMTLLVGGGFMEEQRSDACFNLDLNSKDARVQWEIAFSQAHVTPLLHDFDVKVNRINERLLSDERLSNNPLIKIIHEVVTLGDDVDVNKIHDSHMMWQYRYRVTVDHLTQLMNDNGHDREETRILRHFLQEEHHLRAMCHLPAISRLQQLLLQKYQHRINQADAQRIKVSKFLQEYEVAQRDEIKKLVDEFAEAWKCVRDALRTYTASGYTLPRDNCELAVDGETPIAMLIPCSQGLGLCSVMLLEFLTRKHNEFIMSYCRYKEKASSELPEFSTKEATPAHLISYDPEKDLLPMVLAHCNYSLEIGKGTVISYDFSGIERQLEERLLRGKPKLRFEVSSIVFRGDYSNAVEFHALRSKISQVPLSHAMQMQIVQDCRLHYHSLPDSLAHLDVAIHFLLSVGGDPKAKLITFMCDPLKMSEKIFTTQIRQHCLLMHIQSLWLTLSLEMSRQMFHYQSDPFDTVSNDYHQPLDDDVIHSLHNALQHLNIDTFVSELHECILLNINAQQSRNDEDAVDNANFGLADVITEYINSKDGTEIPSLSNGMFPREILVKHAVSVWTEAVTIQNKEETNRRH